MSLNLLNFFFLLALAIFFNYIYILFAKKYKIYADANERSLHIHNSITGAGIVFLIFFLFSAFIYNIKLSYLNILCISIILIIGLYDDHKGINPIIKLLSQLFVSLLIVIEYGYIFSENYFILFIILIILIWYFNAFNFIDGINGFVTINFMFSLFYLFFLSENLTNLNIMTLEFLFPFLLVFLFINILGNYFMGETGSYFLSFIFLINCIDQIEIKDYWLLIFALLNFPIIDTSITLFNRILKTKYWFKAHRGHAYQNFARLYGHNKMLIIYVSYLFFYLSPLLILMSNSQDYNLIYFLLIILPSFFFCLFFGVFKTEKKFFYEK